MPSFLKWLTGCSGIPPLGFPKKFSLRFVHGCQPECKCCPTVSTYELLLKLPVHISSEEEMEAMMLSALGDSYGFGMIWNPFWLPQTTLSICAKHLTNYLCSLIFKGLKFGKTFIFLKDLLKVKYLMPHVRKHFKFNCMLCVTSKKILHFDIDSILEWLIISAKLFRYCYSCYCTSCSFVSLRKTLNEICCSLRHSYDS